MDGKFAVANAFAEKHRNAHNLDVGVLPLEGQVNGLRCQNRDVVSFRKASGPWRPSPRRPPPPSGGYS